MLNVISFTIGAAALTHDVLAVLPICWKNRREISHTRSQPLRIRAKQSQGAHERWHTTDMWFTLQALNVRKFRNSFKIQKKFATFLKVATLQHFNHVKFILINKNFSKTVEEFRFIFALPWEDLFSNLTMAAYDTEVQKQVSLDSFSSMRSGKFLTFYKTIFAFSMNSSHFDSKLLLLFHVID